MSTVEKVGIGIAWLFVLMLLLFAIRWLMKKLKKEFRQYRERREALQRRFMELQALTDEEFVHLFPPGTNPEVALKVRNIIAYSCGVDPARIRPDMPIADLDRL